MKNAWMVFGLSVGILQATYGVPVTVTPQDGNIILTWRSLASQTYLIQCRASFDTNSTWETLESNWQGQDETTSYTNLNQVPIQSQFLPTPQHETIVGPQVFQSGKLGQIPNQGFVPGLPPMPWDGAILERGVQSDSNGIGGVTTQYGIPTPGVIVGTDSDGPVLQPTYRFYRVTQNGINILGLTNNITLSGGVSFPVELAYSSGTVSSVCLKEDCGADDDVGIGQSLSVSLPPFDGLPILDLDTTRMSNGVHIVYVTSTWNFGGDENGTFPVQIQSTPVSINVYNEISFPAWMDYYGELADQMLITAESGHASADYWIDIYAGYPADEYYYVGTLGGHTDNGHIEGIWDLTGPDGESYSDATCFGCVISTEFSSGTGFQGQTKATANAGGSSTGSAPLTYKTADPWPDKGGWVVANQQAWENLVGSDQLDIVADSFVEGAQALGLTVRPTPDSEQHAFRLQFGSEQASPETRNAQWATFKSAVFDPLSRNLFYLGHGAPTELGNTSDTNRVLSVTEIGAALHTIPVGQTNRHAYRFVFLDGCSTADGKFPEAFGIIHRENVDYWDYMKAAIRPSAFMGWNTDKWIGLSEDVVLADHWKFVQYFGQQWGFGDGVKQAVLNAKTKPDVGSINAKTLKVFGYWGLKLNEFNN